MESLQSAAGRIIRRNSEKLLDAGMTETKVGRQPGKRLPSDLRREVALKHATLLQGRQSTDLALCLLCWFPSCLLDMIHEVR